MANAALTQSRTPLRDRWTQLIAGVICMIMIANLQYGWTLFVHPIAAKHHWSVAAIQVAFSIFVALENVFNSRYSVGRTPIRTVSSPSNARVGIRWN